MEVNLPVLNTAISSGLTGGIMEGKSPFTNTGMEYKEPRFNQLWGLLVITSQSAVEIGPYRHASANEIII